MSAPAPRHMLFVYGTLRPRCGHPMAELLAKRGHDHGEAKIAGQLFDLGRYPAAVATAANDDWIFGDLYEIDEATLAELDHYEAVESPGPSYFARRQGDVTLQNGARLAAWVYWFHGPLPQGATRIVDGQYARIFARKNV